MPPSTYGKESEWNEASFKSMRLHDIQAQLNFFKGDPLGKTDGKFNYVWFARCIDLLYGEGRSKYSDTEKKKTDRIRKIAIDFLRLNNPHKIIINQTLSGSTQGNSFDQVKYQTLMEILYLFETEVKDLNDEHGLTTKNVKEYDGLF